jgi:crotonobetainyl-CoA:carnitine CoA-transferase CaiB-like acyl-CoA transferase
MPFSSEQLPWRRKLGGEAEIIADVGVGATADGSQHPAYGMKLTVRDPCGNPVDLVGNPIHISGCPLATPTIPPRIGEQTDAVLRELGLDEGEVAALRQKGIV